MIFWEEGKNLKLKLKRNISFEAVSEIILNKKYIDILENFARPEQNIFVLEINNYIYAVPFIIDKNSNIILKTAYPSRKLNRKYRGLL